MFFDTILLNTQHGGRFGIAWIAATRGLRYITKKQIKDLNIVKLCTDLELFIISQSTSPKKRFSLRLAAILINGAVKIHREQAIMLQGDIYMITTRVRSVVIFSDDISDLETPPTPIPRVKTKRGKKQKVVETPDAGIKEVEDIFLQLPNIEDILLPPARSDEICIREDLLTKQVQLEDDLGFGMLSGKEAEEELQSLLLKTREAPGSQPQYPSSDSITPQAPIEVVAQVHAPKGSPLVADKRPKPTVAEEIHPDSVRAADTSAGLVREELSKPTEEVPEPSEPQLQEQPHIESITQIPAIDTIIEQPQDPIHVPEIQPVEQITDQQITNIESEVAASRERRNKRSVEVQSSEKSQKGPSVAQRNAKLFINKSRRKFVRINRCNENEGQFADTKCPLPSPFRNVSNDFLYNMFWMEDEESLIQVRARSSVRSVSASDSVGLQRKEGKRSTLEKASVSDLGRPSVISLETQVPDTTPLMTDPTVLGPRTTEDLSEPAVPPIASFSTPRKRKQVSTATEDLIESVQPTIILSTPRKRKRTIAPEDEETRRPTRPQQQSAVEELAVPLQPAEPEIPVDFETITVQPPLIEEEMPVAQTVPDRGAEDELRRGIVPQLIEKERGMPMATVSDYKQRQQNIISMIIRWKLDREITIEDVCEKPINRLIIARAFSDLLTLASNRFLVLINEEGSLELKYIRKGPKLQKA